MTEPARDRAADALTVVSGADWRYWRCLYQLLLSAERHRLPQRHRFVVFDLGLGEARKRLASRFPWCELRGFDLARHPPHLATPLRQNGWKPLVIEEAMSTHGGPILWLDSATIFKAPLDTVLAELRERGLYTLRGQSPLAERCDVAILDALQVPPQTRARVEIVSGVLGLDGERPAVRHLVRLWRERTLVPEYLGTRSSTHRCEQALLSIILYDLEARGEITLGEGQIDISCGSPVQWMSSRNKVPPALPVWADPLSRLYHATYKVVDQWLWRRRHTARRAVRAAKGLHRWPKEHFSVFVGCVATRRVVELRAPPLRYYADPFVWMHDGRRALFVEEFDHRDHLGRLRCMALDAQLRPDAPRTIVERAAHASFPFLFEHGGALYMVPETCHEGCVDLYRCDEFPYRWRLVRRLLDGVDAADSVLVEHENRWWLIGSLRDGGDQPRYLGVFSTSDLLRGDWRAHPVNGRRQYADRPFGFGRNAGAPLRWRGALLRPVQRNARYYGDGMVWMRIAVLTPDEYHEEPFDGELPLAQLSARLAPHHLAARDGLVAWDVRDRLGYWQRVPLMRRFVGTPLSPLARASSQLAGRGLSPELAEELRCFG